MWQARTESQKGRKGDEEGYSLVEVQHRHGCDLGTGTVGDEEIALHGPMKAEHLRSVEWRLREDRENCAEECEKSCVDHHLCEDC